MVNPIVFWFDSKDIKRTRETICRDISIIEPEMWNDGFEHHYLACREVAKLFASGGGQDNDVIYKGLAQSLNALIYYRANNSALSNPEDDTRIILNYPLILYNDAAKLYRVATNEKDAKPSEINENFQLEINYAYLDSKKSQNEHFVLDLVSLGKLEMYLRDLEEKDITTIKKQLIYSSRHNQ